MTDKFKDYKWRDRNKYKWMRRMAVLLPDSKPDVDAVLKQRLRCVFFVVLLSVPLIVLWLPFGLLHKILSALLDCIEALHRGFKTLLSPKELAFHKLHKLSLIAEHGDYKTRIHRLKNEHQWEYPSWHYVNKSKDGA